MQVCTTDELCTLDSCPARCSRPEQVYVVSGALLVGLSAVFLIGTWISYRVYLLAAVALCVIGGTVAFVLTF